MLKKLQLAIIILTLNVSFVVQADVTNWIVKNVVGQAVLTKQDNSRKWIRQFDVVGPGDRVQTYSNATVALVRDAEAMIVSANSEISIPVEGNNSSFTLIFQRLGTILFSAKKKNRKHFEVRTPFSAAIIKGTTLAVNVNRSNAQLQVFEGVVELKRRGKRRSYIVRSGGKALTPRDQNRPVKLNKVRNTSLITPHFGNDVKKLTETYISKISIGKTRAKKFKLTNAILNKQQKSRITPKGLQPSTTEILHQVKTKNANKERRDRSKKNDVKRDKNYSDSSKSKNQFKTQNAESQRGEQGRSYGHNKESSSKDEGKVRSNRGYKSENGYKNKSVSKGGDKDKSKFKANFKNHDKNKSRASSKNSQNSKSRSSSSSSYKSKSRPSSSSSHKNKSRSSSSSSYKSKSKSNSNRNFKSKNKSRSSAVSIRGSSFKGSKGKHKK